LNWNDYGARNYDSQLGRFHVTDKFTEMYYSFSPYHYTLNNPIRFIDINGDSVGVDKSITQNKLLNKSYEQFAKSKQGFKFR
jgi:hypothetical protein